MENLSVKNALVIVASVIGGFYMGQVVGAITGFILWSFIGLMLGGLLYYSNVTIAINTVLSTLFGIVLSLLIGSFDRMFFGSQMSLKVWAGIGTVVGLAIMFSYGTRIIADPEIYGQYEHLVPGAQPGEAIRTSEDSQSFRNLSQISYGNGTGAFIGLYLGSFAGLIISVRETLGRKRKPEDKKEFDEYSKFFKERLKIE